MPEISKFMIIDGNALLHRAFHALPPLSSKDGTLVNAVYGFTTVLMKALREIRPAFAAVTFDLPGPTFRDKLYKEYKATRTKQPDELYAQLPMIKEVVRAFNIPVVEKQGVEADDVIATLVEKFGGSASGLPEAEPPHIDTIIVTGDMDLLQLVDKHTKVYGFRKGMSDTVIYDTEAIRQRYGLKPEQLVDYKALRGDPSDNIPGVKGVGEKTAAELIRKFGSLDNLYANIARAKTGNEKPEIKERILKLLEAHKADALLGKKLVELKHDVEIKLAPDNCKIRKPNIAKLRELFEKFEFRNLVKKLDDEYGVKTQITQPKAQMSLLNRTAEKNTNTENAVPVYGKPKHPGVSDIATPVSKQIQVAAYLLNIGDRGRTLESIAKEYGYASPPSGGAPPLGGEVAQQLLQKLEADLTKQNLFPLYEQIEKPLIPILENMECLGIKTNLPYLKKLSGQFGKELADLEKKIYEFAGVKFNINSPAQLREILYDNLGLAPEAGRIKKTAKGRVASTAAGELEKLRGSHPLVKLIFEYRELAKLKSTYTDALVKITDRTGRVHTTFNQTITATGRLSSSNPNLQNIPIRTERGRAIRKAFLAERGFALLSADYSQIELRVAASLSGDPEMIKAFQSGYDFHTETAVRIFEVAPDKVDAEMRRKAKAINFGIIYGMGATALAQSTGMSRSEAEQFIARYFEIYQTLYAFLEDQKTHARNTGFVATLFGRRRYLPQITSGVQQVRAAAERMAINMPVQGSAADLMKLAMVKLDEQLRAKSLVQRAIDSMPYALRPAPIRMLLQVHDELIFEVKEEMVSKVAPQIKQIMENVHKLKVPIIVDLKIGQNWGEMEELRINNVE